MVQMIHYRQFIVIIGLLSSLNAIASEFLSLEIALQVGLHSNPEVLASKARWQTESAQIRSQYWLENPKVGLIFEKNTTAMQQNMTSVSISQEVKFPVKYFLLGSAQASKSAAAQEEFQAKKFEIRHKIITAYYGLYSSKKIVNLVRAQKETLREIARIAEARRATGKVPQQDEMKAHVEQTKAENEFIVYVQEELEAKLKLSYLLNQDVDSKMNLPEILSVPLVKEDLEKNYKDWLNDSPVVKKERQVLGLADTKATLAKFSYAPDFLLSYKKTTSNTPPGAYEIGVEASIPLWFFAKQTAETASARSQVIEAEKNFESTKRQSHSELRSLISKVKAQENILKIHETSLIPQGVTTLNSSRASYQAGSAGFLELLDSERMLYDVKISYFRVLAQYVESLTKLEFLLGRKISSLPLGEVP